MSETIRVEDAGGVTTLTLNRPARRNAPTQQMQLESIDALHDAGSDRKCHVIVLVGQSEVFSRKRKPVWSKS